MTVRFLRDAMTRLSRDGWKRHAGWLVAEYGREERLVSVALYRNYPDRNDRLTSVRLHSWFDPLRSESALELPRIVERADERFDELREQLASGAVSWRGGLLVLPVHAGTSWWGALVVRPGEESHGADSGDAEDAGMLIATLLGDAIHDESTHQALRWSERLHRIQRDIALAAGRGGSTRGSVSELLSLVCEFGEFDAGAVDLLRHGSLARIAQIGLPPAHASREQCAACLSRFSPERGLLEPRYLDSDDLVRTPACEALLEDVHAIAVIPLVTDGELAGVIELFSTRRSHIPESVRRSLEAVAAEIALLLVQVRLDEAARELGERYQLAVEAGRIGVWEYRRADAVVLVDQIARGILGAHDGSARCRLADFLAPFDHDDRETLRAWLDAEPGSADGSTIDFERECRVRRLDESRGWVVVRARHRESDVPGSFVGTVLDVTPTKEIQAALQRARREADELSRAKSTFMARMSHEFRTPLNAILGYVQMLRDEAGPGAGLDRIEQSSLHLLSMVENILDQNRVESGALHLRPESVPLRDVLRTVAEVGALLARTKGLDFAIVEEGPLPERISLDGTRLRQVLYNLVSNAATYTDEGSVTVHVRWRDRLLRFAVTDTGRGIAPEDRGRVFLPFARSRGQEGAGSGLGLAISQELVQAMGSRIWLASVTGMGSVFWFSLAAPAADDTAPAAAADDRSTGRARTGDGPAGATYEEQLPPALVHELEAHARIGDLEAIRTWADERARAGSAGDLTLEIRALAARFRVRAIRELLASLGGEP